LVIGTGANGALPVMKEVKAEAKERKIELLVLPTYKAIEALMEGMDDTDLPPENHTIGEEAQLCCHGPNGGGL
jgi:hypothetical protein